MIFLEKIYYFLRDLSSLPEERGERSAGFLQDKIRKAALTISADYHGRLLEVGCGEGLFLTQLSEINSKVEAWGVDKWPQILARASERFKKAGITQVRLVEAQAGQLPFEDAYFDAVVFIDVLICFESLEKARPAVREIGRVLKPGGKLIIEFRNKRNILLRAKYKFAKFYDPTIIDHPLSTYHEDDILGLLREYGLEAKKIKYLGSLIKKLAPVIIVEAQKHV